MAQAFITTAKNTFRWNVQEKTKPKRFGRKNNSKNINSNLILNGNRSYLLSQYVAISSAKPYLPLQEHFEEIEKAVKELQVKRMSSTTYRTDYCKDWKKVIDSESKEDIVENELAKNFEQLYGEKKTRKILPTIESQRILGFLASSRMYTPITTYQNDYGRLGYERLPKIVTKI
ncbi:uncharacterized protein LOC130445269 [Diorhabda sublineata]|uniref:uncharacterized protein LOC130445269 n=1 Tax=Diorhabda sublineata TaxID=1163346 RepID=UPI0024E084CD|nr:uncharacterized protein LOC130445269 [Diorhabda sublineata]